MALAVQLGPRQGDAMTTITGKTKSSGERATKDLKPDKSHDVTGGAPKASTAKRQAKSDDLLRDKDLMDDEYWALH
jgi:hypothetical protein